MQHIKSNHKKLEDYSAGDCLGLFIIPCVCGTLCQNLRGASSHAKQSKTPKECMKTLKSARYSQVANMHVDRRQSLHSAMFNSSARTSFPLPFLIRRQDPLNSNGTSAATSDQDPALQPHENGRDYTPQDLQDLYVTINRTLVSVHVSWQRQFTQVCEALIVRMHKLQAEQHSYCSVALLVLPGLVQYMKRKNELGVKDFLNVVHEAHQKGTNAAYSPEELIITYAIFLKSRMPSITQRQHDLSVRFFEKMTDNGRFTSSEILNRHISRLETKIRNKADKGQVKGAGKLLDQMMEIKRATDPSLDESVRDDSVRSLKPLSLDDERRIHASLNPDFLPPNPSSQGSGSSSTSQPTAGSSTETEPIPANTRDDGRLTAADIDRAMKVDALEITADDIIQGLSSLQNDSAGGLSGWTNSLLKRIFYTKQLERHRVAENILLPFFQRFLKGDVPSDHWTASRAVLIPKDILTPGKYRPLGIGEVWYRLLGKIVLRSLNLDIAGLFGRIQVGLGTRGGSEIASKITQWYLGLDPNNHVVINLDLTNAFNTMSRRLILDNILDPKLGFLSGYDDLRPTNTRLYSPRHPMHRHDESKIRYLAPLFAWAYGSCGILRNTAGSIVGTNYIGTRQGDPLGSLFFCIGLHKVLTQLHDIVVKETANAPYNHAINNSGGAATTAPPPLCLSPMAYIDDITIFCHRAIAAKICNDTCDTMAKAGFILSFPKCCITGKNLEVMESTWTPSDSDVDRRIRHNLNVNNGAHLFTIQSRGTSLGVPIGNDEWVKQEVTRKLTTMLRPIPLLDMFGAAFSFCVIRQCIQTRATYLSKCLEPWSTFIHLFRRFDDYIFMATSQRCFYPTLPEPNLLLESTMDSLLSYSADSEVHALQTPSSTPVFQSPDSYSAIVAECVSNPTLAAKVKAIAIMERAIAELPPDMGGLGIHRIAGISGHKGCILARARALDFCYYRGYEDFSQLVISYRKRLGMYQLLVSESAYAENPQSVPELYATPTLAPEPYLYFDIAAFPGKHDLSEEVGVARKNLRTIIFQVLSSVLKHDDHHFTRIWRSHVEQYEGKGHWLHHHIILSQNKNDRFSDCQWQANLDLALLRHPILRASSPELLPLELIPKEALEHDPVCHELMNFLCPGCKSTKNILHDDPYHCLHCLSNQYEYIHRHDAVIGVLVKQLRSVAKGNIKTPFLIDPEPAFIHIRRAAGGVVSTGINPHTGEGRKRADLLIRKVDQLSDGSTMTSDYIIDVAVCSPLAPSYAPSSDLWKPWNVTDKVEEIKYRKYNGAIQAITAEGNGVLFRPMVFTAAGDAGGCAYGILADHLQLPANTVFSTIGKVAVKVSQHNARMIVNFKRRILPFLNSIKQIDPVSNSLQERVNLCIQTALSNHNPLQHQYKKVSNYQRSPLMDLSRPVATAIRQDHSNEIVRQQ